MPPLPCASPTCPVCALGSLVDQALYRYFIWRQGTFSDLALVAVVNLFLVALGAGLKMSLLPHLGVRRQCESRP